MPKADLSLAKGSWAEVSPGSTFPSQQRDTAHEAWSRFSSVMLVTLGCILTPEARRNASYEILFFLLIL